MDTSALRLRDAVAPGGHPVRAEVSRAAREALAAAGETAVTVELLLEFS